MNEQADEHIKTKLNLLFNYIINNADGEKIGLKEKDRSCLVRIFKQLDIYISNENTCGLMSEQYVQDLKIMMWSIKEIYQSPYKILLNDLNNKQLVHKFLKTKKYIVEKKQNYRLEEVISYFIVCLQDEFERRNDI